jgi:hypothetical protein
MENQKNSAELIDNDAPLGLQTQQLSNISLINGGNIQNKHFAKQINGISKTNMKELPESIFDVLIKKATLDKPQK